MLEDYEAMAAYHGNNYLPLLWRSFKSHRAVIFRFLKSVQAHATSQDQSVVDAWRYLLANEQRKGALIPADLPLDFASEQWQRTIRRVDAQGRLAYDRRHLEVCICAHIAADFKSGDLATSESQEFGDLREQLASWEECQALLEEYCQETQLPPTGQEFVGSFKTQFIHLAQQVDATILQDAEVVISADGELTVKRPLPTRTERSADRREASNPTDADVTQPIGPGALISDGEALSAAIQPLMPRRSVLEILKNAHFWTGWTRHFGPLSGSDPKLDDPITRYIILAFGQGCNLGFAQTARHLRNNVSAHELSFTNRRHVVADRIDRGSRRYRERIPSVRAPHVLGQWEDGGRRWNENRGLS